jgi:hypothetical protein
MGWVLIHHSWYRYTGDTDYLNQQRDYLTGLLGVLTQHVGPDHRAIIGNGSNHSKAKASPG